MFSFKPVAAILAIILYSSFGFAQEPSIALKPINCKGARVWIGEADCPGLRCVIGRIATREDSTSVTLFENGFKGLSSISHEQQCTGKDALGKLSAAIVAETMPLADAENFIRTGLESTRAFQNRHFEVIREYVSNNGSKFFVELECGALEKSERSCSIKLGTSKFYGDGKVFPDIGGSIGSRFAGASSTEVFEKIEARIADLVEWYSTQGTQL